MSEQSQEHPTTTPIDRAFVRLDEGLVHYRTVAATNAGSKPPLYIAHPGPGSSRAMEPLLEAMVSDRKLIAPDSLGFGDSAAPAVADPDVEYFADSVVRVLDALEIDTCDFYGSHTGAHIGCELAIHHPSRVRRVIFDGVSVFPDALRQELLEHYAPSMQPDDHGGQFTWAWQFIRDQAVHFPYYQRDPKHRTAMEMWPPEMLHEMVIDVLKALTTYDKGYKAVFRHEVEERLPMVNHRSLVIAYDRDPLCEYIDAAASLLPNAVKETSPGEEGPAGMALRLKQFLDAS